MFRRAFPFVVAMLVCLAILTLFPGIATWLVRLQTTIPCPAAEVFAWQEIVAAAPKRLSDGVFIDPEVLDFAGAALTAFVASLPRAA